MALFYKGSIWYLTEGFTVAHYYSTHTATEKLPKEIDEILDQPFTYVSKGKEFAVFASADGKWVVKLVRENRFRLSGLKVKEPPFLQQIIETKRQKKLAKRDRLCTSCQIAGRTLKEETELYYLALAGADKHLELYDTLGRSHTIDLAKTAFLLQKRATLLYPTIAELMESGKVEEAKECLISLISVLKARLDKEIMDYDPSIKKNVGFIGTKAVLLDTGEFTQNERACDQKIQHHQILIALLELKSWLSAHYPTLLPFLEALIAPS